MSAEQEKQNKELFEGLKTLRETVESKQADTGEAKEKIAKIEKMLGDIQEKQEKKLAEETEKSNAIKAEMDLLKEDCKNLHKQKDRIGIGTNKESEDELHKKYKIELSTYFRKGIKPSSEIIEEISQNLLEKHIISKDENDLMVHKSFVTGNDTQGGYLVFPDRRTDITVTRVFETSPMRSVANIITTTSSSVEILVDDDEAESGGWVGEVQQRDETGTPTFLRLDIANHEQHAKPQITQKMIDDSSIDIEAFLMRKISNIITRTENTAFVNGNGSAKPRGFLDYDAWAVPETYERDKLERINSGVTGEIKADALIELQNSLIETYDANAVFLLKRKTWGKVLKLKSGDGNYLMNFEMLPEGVAALTLLAKRVWFANDMPAIADDSEPIAYGDFNTGYTIVDRLGMRVLRDPFTATPFIKFIATKRVGGAVTNYEAIKILKLSA